MKAKKTM